MSKQPDTQTMRERLTKLFEFLKAYTDLRYPPVRDINQQIRILWLKDLPAHSSVELFRDVGKTDEEDEDSDIVLRLTRPTTTPCPPPPAALSAWLKLGWREYRGTVEVEATRNVVTDGKTRIERFEDNYQRPALLRDWQRQRDLWVTNERPARHALTFFQTVYEWYGILEREGEKIEMLAGDGLLRCPDAGGEFRHPVLLQKLELEFYPEKKQPQFVFRKREQPPELYMEFLRALPEVNNQQLARCADELKKAEFAPLGGEDTEGFLRRLIQGLFPSRGNLIEDDEQQSDAGTGLPLFNQPQSAAEQDSSTIQRQPVIFMRLRRTGPGSVFDAVLSDIASRIDFSPALMQILGLAESAPIQSESAAGGFGLGNEDEDILLSKPANQEQLEIAKQLARKDCVLVQGPPGTGKTHTIANLLGHLLAQGKRVLVTAHTPKALRVLREKVVEPLRPLCVSILQNDKQSQDELQASVKKINEQLSKDDRQLEREAGRLREDRKRILKALRAVREKFLDARQDEIRDVVFAGKSTRPIEAAKRVKAGAGKDDWIPSPVTLGESLPVSIAEVVALYQTNARVSAADERELNGFRPELSALPTPKEFQSVVEELNSLAGCNLRFREELWDANLGPDDLKEFDRMLETANKTIEFLRDSAPWQLEAIQAGRDGDEARRVWVSLSELIETTWREVQECYALVVEYGPAVSDPRPPHELLPLVEEIIKHSEAGNSFGLLTKLTRRHWFEFIEKAHVSNRALDPKNISHLQAVRADIRIRVLREDLLQRWSRLIACQGGPACADLTEKPEQVSKQFVTRIQICLEWHTSTWQPLESEFQRLGFLWSAFLESTPPETGANAELNRIRRAVLGELGTILQSRSGWLRHKRLGAILAGWPETVPTSETPDALVSQRLRRAMREASPTDYQAAYEELARLKNLEIDSSIPLNPHVVHYRVEGGRDRGDNVNEIEAETIAALICAATEQPEFAKNDQGKPTTFGVVSLIAHNQALKTDGILRQRLEPAEYQRRQILCGDSAQFQGDERDVMFLSVVDSPPAEPPLPMRQEGGKKIFKKRFNVAASRARNQMWIVHSLNHEIDLKVGDYRRNLIEHALDPNAWERELRKRMERTESIFEERVLRRLMESRYNVLPQFQVGAYRIDLVVTGNGRRLAVECDGERWHGPEKLREDAERQAILERLGWKFVRIRGSLFFRDEDRALKAMFARLAELNITPEFKPLESKASSKSEVVDRVIRRAQELQAAWHSNGGTSARTE